MFSIQTQFVKVKFIDIIDLCKLTMGKPDIDCNKIKMNGSLQTNNSLGASGLSLGTRIVIVFVQERKYIHKNWFASRKL